MRSVYLLLICFFSALAANSQAPNYVIVKGYITNTNGTAVNNWPVYIIPDTSSTVSCSHKQKVYTNANGFYIDTLTCTNPLLSVTIYTMNCNNTSIVRTLQVPSSKVIESNFILCVASNISCEANFSFSVFGNNVFFTNTSIANTGSVITQNIWNFGDGISFSSGATSLNHIYTTSGSFIVKLIIVSSNGCRDSIVKIINISPAGTACNANFSDSIVYKTSFFNSSISTTSTGDMIIERFWNFGDPNSINNILTGNVVDPKHVYTNNGTYMVCLKTVTQYGCIDSTCKTITINSTQTSCTPYFTFSTNGLYAGFNSTYSQVSAGDSIVRRKWFFGDGDTLGGNVVSPYHTYATSGTYQACLIIYTANGCQRDICKSVVVTGPNTQCLAAFTTTVVSTSPYAIAFNSSTSQTSFGDSINERFWTFGDGTSGVGTINTHTYTSGGSYTVCLYIISVSGCRDTICSVVQVPTTSCQSYFTMTISAANSHLIYFNSTSSSPTSIISRIWTFGDGDSLSGNVITPTHTYANAGTYTVCLKIITANGCQNTICKTITITGQQCRAKFTYGASPTVPPTSNSVLFNSSTSETRAGDSIITRLWYFGDNNYLSGNEVSPIHNYANAGTYTVCLTITTASGCSDSICQQIQVPLQNTPACYAVFSASPSIFNNYEYSFNSINSYTVPVGNITSRTWIFGDGDTLRGNVVNPQHLYANAGNYVVCLIIESANRCDKRTCLTISIKPTHCQSKFTTTVGTGTLNGYNAYFNSSSSNAVTGDSINQRYWSFGDGTGLTSGNVVSPVHSYTTAGTYTVCLYIHTYKGCTDSSCMQVSVPSQTCKAEFSYISSGGIIRFLGNYTTNFGLDTITSRLWSFGDGTYLTAGNVVNPIHTYLQSGTYQVCLVIHTSKGCQSTTCKSIVVTTSPINCTPVFTIERVPNLPLSIRFNSTTSSISNQDSIISRVWSFGDGTSLFSGNVINPIKNYLVAGPYIVCLKIKTRLGCQNEVCQTVRAGDTTNVGDTTTPFRIISLTPNPVITSFTTVVWSKFQNINAEYAIYDIYGVKKWSLNRLLTQGNNVLTIPSYNLLTGPYFLRVTTIYGTKSRKFYKM